jgi:hypothetical protein
MQDLQEFEMLDQRINSGYIDNIVCKILVSLSSIKAIKSVTIDDVDPESGCFIVFQGINNEIRILKPYEEMKSMWIEYLNNNSW